MAADFDPYSIEQQNAERGAQVIQIDNGKHIAAVAICAAICGLALAVALWAGYQAQVMTTEYRVVLNHTMEMEAKQKIIIDEVEALKHGNR